MLGDVAFAQAPFASQGGNTFNVAVSETGSIASTPDIGSVIFGGFITEGASALASFSGPVVFSGINSESASGAAVFDTLNNTFNVLFSSAASGAALGADTRVGNYIGPVSIQESAVGDDTVNVLKTFNVDATGVQLVVRIGSILIWAEIDDSQDPNWQNIPT